MSIDVVLRAGSLFMKIYGHMGKKLLLLKIQGISRILGSSALFHLRNEICDFKFATLVLLFAFCTLFEIIFFLCCLLVWLLRFAFLYSLLSYFVMAFIETCIFKQNSNLLVGQKKKSVRCSGHSTSFSWCAQRKHYYHDSLLSKPETDRLWPP